MANKKNHQADLSKNQDSLVQALESIKSLLQKSDAKLAAARESIAIASNQTELGSLDIHDSAQFEIPELDDIVIPSEQISEISEKIEETLAAVSGGLPLSPNEPSKPDPQVILNYLDTIQGKLEKTIRDSLMKNIVTIETGLKKSMKIEFDKIRKQIKKDLK